MHKFKKIISICLVLTIFTGAFTMATLANDFEINDAPAVEEIRIHEESQRIIMANALIEEFLNDNLEPKYIEIEPFRVTGVSKHIELISGFVVASGLVNANGALQIGATFIVDRLDSGVWRNVATWTQSTNSGSLFYSRTVADNVPGTYRITIQATSHMPNDPWPFMFTSSPQQFLVR